MGKKPDDGTDAANAAGTPERVSGLEEGSSDTPNKTNSTQTDTETDGTSGSGSTPRETETTDDKNATSSFREPYLSDKQCQTHVQCRNNLKCIKNKCRECLHGWEECSSNDECCPDQTCQKTGTTSSCKGVLRAWPLGQILW